LACNGGTVAEHAAALGVKVLSLPLSSLRRNLSAPLHWVYGTAALAELIRHQDVSLVCGNTLRATVYAAPAARVTGRPFLWYMQDFWLSETRPRILWPDKLVKQVLCATASAIATNSRAVADCLPCKPKISVIYCGIEIERFSSTLDGTQFRNKYNIPLNAPLVGTVGRLRPWKGQDRFLQAMARVAEETIPAAWFVVVGGVPFGSPDDYPKCLRHLAADLGLADRVIFTGHLADVRPALAAMDAFVHPGDPEPFGLVNLEAMAMGKPVVAFAHGALPEIVVDGETGVLVPPRDEMALAEAVVALLRDPARRAAMGQKGRTRVEECFTAERMAAELEAILQDIVG